MSGIPLSRSLRWRPASVVGSDAFTTQVFSQYAAALRQRGFADK